MKRPAHLSACGPFMAIYPGSDLLSRKLYRHYHRPCSVSLPCSEWERVVPLRQSHREILRSCRRWAITPPRETTRLTTTDNFHVKNDRFSDNCIQERGYNAEVVKSLPSLLREKLSDQASRLISTGQLTCCHVYTPGLSTGSSSPSLQGLAAVRRNLGRRLALRCFQRLSFPHTATRRCP